LIVVPDGDDEDAGLMVEALIGVHPYRFLLDTGTGQSCV